MLTHHTTKIPRTDQHPEVSQDTPNLLPWLNSPIFIGGHEKSGTNLILSLLDNHPQLVVFYMCHLHLFQRYLRRISNHSTGQQKISAFITNHRAFDNLRRNFVKGNTNIYLADNEYNVTQLIDQWRIAVGQQNDWLSVIKGLFYSHCLALNMDPQNPTIRGAVDSSPGNEFSTDLIMALFPQAKNIHIIRDPRDNWTSWKKSGHHRMPRTLWQFIGQWNMSTSIAIHNRHKFPNDYLIVSYSAITTQSAKAIKEMATFLSIKHNNSLLSPTKHGHVWSGNSAHNKEFSSIDASSNKVYQSELSRSEISIIEHMCLPYFKQAITPSSTTALLPKISRAKYLNILRSGTLLNQNDNVKIPDITRGIGLWLYNQEQINRGLPETN